MLNFLLGLLVLYPVFYFLLKGKAPYTKAFALMRIWARWIMIVPGIYVKRDYHFNPSTLNGPCVFVANHHSYLDIIMSYWLFDHYFVFVGKAEIKNAPLFNIFFKDMNILVDRGSASSGAVAFAKCADRIDKGESIFLFPEGRIESKGKMIPFKNGAFKLAIDKQVPIVPVTYCNNWQLLQNGGFFKSHGKPGVAHVIIHSPIYTTGLTQQDLVYLKQQTFDVIQAPLLK